MPFTPEFTDSAKREIVLVSNHSLSSVESTAWSIEYNRARVVFGHSQLPPGTWEFRIIYDIRDQDLPDHTIDKIRTQLSDIASVEFKR
jgi:hypothetical protein